MYCGINLVIDQFHHFDRPLNQKNPLSEGINHGLSFVHRQRTIALDLRLGEGVFIVDRNLHKHSPTPQPLGECNAYATK
jgi:hypothetical protein